MIMSNFCLKCRLSGWTFLLATGLLFSLSACGGSGGGSSGSPRTVQSILYQPGVNRLGEVADNEPIAGSVTQGSRGNRVTADRVSWASGRIELIGNSGREMLSPSDDADVVSGAEVFRGENSMSVLVSRVTVPTFEGLESNTDAIGYDTTDPLVFGLWAYDGGGGEVEWGVFADGQTVQKTPASSIPTSGTPEYRGQTFGAYENFNTEDSDSAGVFVADVSLTADFAGGSVSGEINNIVDRESRLPDGGSSILLKDARISRSEDGGFFKGDTALMLSGGTEDSNFSGKWGGQFFGDGAQHIGGTWGVSDGSSSVVGAFSATKE